VHTLYNARVCNKEESTRHLHDSDLLLVCGQYNKLQLLGDYVTRPAKHVGFQIKPNYEGNTPKNEIDS
jgi:hypothetical protein